MSLAPTRRRLRNAARLAGMLAMIATTAHAGPTFNLDFSQNPTLPSAQGLTYGDPPSGPEALTFHVVNGLLHLDTKQFPNDTQGYYQYLNGYDHTVDAEIVAKVKVMEMTGSFGSVFGYYDSAHSNFVVVTPTGWSIYGTGVTGTFADPSAFHVLDLKTTAATSQFSLSVDGVQVATGSQFSGFGGPTDVYFGDGSPTGGNMVADIAYVRYSNNPFASPSAVPEPSTVVGAVLAGVAGLAVARRRSPR